MPTYLTRDTGINTRRTVAADDATAIVHFCGADFDRLHMHGLPMQRPTQYGACKPVWRLERGADGRVRQQPVNACARSRGGAGEVVDAALLLPEPVGGGS